MNFREIEKTIKKDGWFLVSVNGSHYHYMHQIKKWKVTIPYYKGDLPLKTANSILKQAGLK